MSEHSLSVARQLLHQALGAMPSDVSNRVALCSIHACRAVLTPTDAGTSPLVAFPMHFDAVVDGDSSRLVAAIGAQRTGWRPSPSAVVTFLDSTDAVHTPEVRVACEYATLLTTRTQVSPAMAMRIARPAAQFALWSGLLMESRDDTDQVIRGEDLVELASLGPAWFHDVASAPDELRQLVARGADYLLSVPALRRYVVGVDARGRADPGVICAARRALTATRDAAHASPLPTPERPAA